MIGSVDEQRERGRPVTRQSKFEFLVDDAEPGAWWKRSEEDQNTFFELEAMGVASRNTNKTFGDINMKKFFALATAIALFSVSLAQAGQVTFEGDVGTRPAGSTSGVLNLVIDLDSIDNLQNGGLSFGIAQDNSGLVTFTGATINNPSGRWTVTGADPLTATGVSFNIFSVQSPAFPTGGQDQLIATVNYTLAAGVTGTSNLSWVVNPEESIVDGRNFGTNVTPNYTFVPNSITVGVVVPEPATLAMAGLSLICLVLRRRNG